ncbi:tRNA (adenine(37)-N6)-methyltransferase-like [Lytechinus variegatus]|uniref:tRNA (adenine(37)-N6)-methyltransferase-like n=1 Tax=Lytechinus variegatus TaxID=7654 RepID=UPI001BB1D2D2|nr:tRNA (adenine(37)-N6)-methyltransferase-like [Lytechinus variegatus]
MLQHLTRLRRSLFTIPDIIRSMSNLGQSSVNSAARRCSTDTSEAHSQRPSVSSGTLSLTSPIGYIRSCFKSKNGTPRQPSVCGYARAKLQILKSVFVCPDHSLDGLSQFSHVWILFVFHENSQEKFTKAKVKPPRLNGRKVGVFASRSPHRPNPIGLTLARLDKVEGNTLYLSGVDMIDRTPVLDIKPYVTDYDNPKQASTRTADNAHMQTPSEIQLGGASGVLSEMQETQCGLESSQANCVSLQTDQPEERSKDSTRCPRQSINVVKLNSHINDRSSDSDTIKSEDGSRTTESIDGSEDNKNVVRVADWVGAPPIKKLAVRFTPSAEAQLASFWRNPDLDHKLEFLDSYDEAHQAVEDILSADPRSVYRRNSCSDRLYYFTLDNLHITCWFGAGFAEVLQVQPIDLADIPKQTGDESVATFKVKT